LQGQPARQPLAPVSSIVIRMNCHRTLKPAVYASLLLSILNAGALADSWSFRKEKTETVHQFGKTKILRIVDATNDQQYPSFTVDIYTDDQLVGRYGNVSFDQIFSSKDNSLFVGLSNNGLPGTAILIFDSSGNLKLEIKHGLGHFRYCEESASLVRTWFSAEHADFAFEYAEGNEIKDMTLRLCDGKLASLNSVIENAYNK